MVKVEVDFVIPDPQTDGSELFFHSTEGWAKSTSPSDLKVLVRENTNIQDEIEIVAFRELPPETLKFPYSNTESENYLIPGLRRYKDMNHYWRLGLAEARWLAWDWRLGVSNPTSCFRTWDASPLLGLTNA